MKRRQIKSELSLSQEWIELSRAMYGKNFIDELAQIFHCHHIETILECGCGGGHILAGLMKRGFKVFGIDANDEMINIARKNYPHLPVEKMNWLDLENLKENFDCVMCRGNSLAVVGSWDVAINSDFFKYEAFSMIKRSLDVMFKRVKCGGMLYVDTISNEEINSKGRKVHFKNSGIDLEGEITHDWKKRIRHICGGGVVNGKKFYGGSFPYLMTPDELIGLMMKLRQSAVYTPILINETNYYVVLAEKSF